MSDQITAGDPIEIRDAFGEWHPSIARSGVHLNTEHCGRQTPWLVVQVNHDGLGHLVNWPAADVRLSGRNVEPGA